uniref:Uncharacterized protein n=1 Tax=Anguilla anguilla TaxID=7936 RepID=A0A0E9R9A7_ANGAN
MRERALRKGVISGVPVSVDADCFLEVEGVFGARRMKS